MLTQFEGASAKFLEGNGGSVRRGSVEIREGGALVFQYRFRGSFNLNTHLHEVVVDGVFEKEVASDSTERIKFHALPPQHPVELTAVAYDVCRRFLLWLKKKGLERCSIAWNAMDWLRQYALIWFRGAPTPLS